MRKIFRRLIHDRPETWYFQCGTFDIPRCHENGSWPWRCTKASNHEMSQLTSGYPKLECHKLSQSLHNFVPQYID